jgi:tRNA nucleotidyltransferase (CCA-adding enzyme)
MSVSAPPDSGARKLPPELIRVVFERVLDLAHVQKLRTFIVGGAVRDHLIWNKGSNGHREALASIRDLDIVVEGDARAFATSANETLRGKVQTFDRFLTAKIIAPEAIPGIAEIDFASTRTEIYERSGALPTVKLATLDADLRRRDFSINALAVPLERAGALTALDAPLSSTDVIDQFEGVQDIEHGFVKTLHPGSFVDDPTRLFRAVRYTGRLGFALADSSQREFAAAVSNGALKEISAARVFTEVRKILKEPDARGILLKCDELQLFANWLPRQALSDEEFTRLLVGLSAGVSEHEFLKRICKAAPDQQPQSWGLSLSRAVVKELLE